MRCEILGGRRGLVAYVGKIAGLDRGYWVGIKLDEPSGDNNGTCGDKKYFEAGNRFGKFERPRDVKTGDYPEIDDFDEEEDMI